MKDLCVIAAQSSDENGKQQQDFRSQTYNFTHQRTFCQRYQTTHSGYYAMQQIVSSSLVPCAAKCILDKIAMIRCDRNASEMPLYLICALVLLELHYGPGS